MILATVRGRGEILEEGEALLKRPANRFSRTQRRMSSKNGARRTASRPPAGYAFQDTNVPRKSQGNPTESQHSRVASVAGSLYLPAMPATVILLYKPFGVLSQFTREGEWKTLADCGPFPDTVYPAGRLDAESEGLLVLTDDNRIKRGITEPRFMHPRTYVVQVERIPGIAALERLRHGVTIEGKRTRDAEVTLLGREPDFPPRPVPIRFRKSVPTAWLELRLTEGRNRQVRKMTAAVGHPTLRLIRTRSGDLSREGRSPGLWRSLTAGEVRLLIGSQLSGSSGGSGAAGGIGAAGPPGAGGASSR